jgi:chitinase
MTNGGLKVSWIVIAGMLASAGCAGHSSQSFSPLAQQGRERAAPPTQSSSFVFSQYKDTSINMNWSDDVLSTRVTGTFEPLLDAMPAKNAAVTLAFATGTCGSETWAGLSPADLISANMRNFVDAAKYYVISTGGANGTFLCPTASAFLAFVQAYYTSSMLGVDFDIEAGQTQPQIDDLVQDVRAAQAQYPTMRFSFTVPTLGGNANPALGYEGALVMKSIGKLGLSNYLIDLMTMDYGSANPGNCVVVKGRCEMGKSAVRAAIDLHTQFGVPYTNIEITPMIGGNDSQGETFTISDAAVVSSFVKRDGLAGVHFWSFDRDRDCRPGNAKSTCNTYRKAGTLGFTKAFITDLGL